MTAKLDLAKMEAAFKRAAHKALHGTREERSGRFLPRQSSAIRDIDYDEYDATLDITFTSGKTYRYRDVPPEIYADFTDAVSKGAFFNDHIKGAFNYLEVTKRRSS